MALRRDEANNPIQDVAVGFILIGVSLVIALTILPVISGTVNSVVNPTNATGAPLASNLSATDGTLLGLLPTLLIVGLIAGGVAFLFKGFARIRT